MTVDLEDERKVHLQPAELQQEQFQKDVYHCKDGICNEDLRPLQEVQEEETNLGPALPHIVQLGGEYC